MKLNWIYKLLRILNDLSAINKNKAGRRIGRRVAGKASGRLFGKIFK